MTKPISKSKRQLAQLLTEAGVTQFPKGANWAAQCSKDTCASFYGGERPQHNRGESVHYGDYCGNRHDVKLPTLIPNWHQTVLSRDEFDQIVAETVVPDSDGWVHISKAGCPVDPDDVIQVKFRNDDGSGLKPSKAVVFSWAFDGSGCDVVAYRLHKPECVEPATTPTLDHLLQDWRNADDYAQRKQTEADEAASMRDERWQAVQARAGEMGVTVGRCEPAVVGDDGWIEWGGGECPVAKGTFVDIRVRDGREELNLAANMITSGRNPDASCAFWQHDGVRGDIVAYRLTRP